MRKFLLNNFSKKRNRIIFEINLIFFDFCCGLRLMKSFLEKHFKICHTFLKKESLNSFFFNVCIIELLTFTSALLYHFQPYVLWLAASSWDLASVALTKKDAQCLCQAIPCLSQLWVAWYSFLDFLPAMELNRLVTGFIAQQHYYSENRFIMLDEKFKQNASKFAIFIKYGKFWSITLELFHQS